MWYDVAEVLDYFAEDFFRLFMKVWNYDSEIMKKFGNQSLIYSEYILHSVKNKELLENTAIEFKKKTSDTYLRPKPLKLELYFADVHVNLKE